MLFLMAAIALFVPSVMAAEAPTYDEENKALFANGTPVTVEARTDGVAGALVKWNGGEKLLPADITYNLKTVFLSFCHFLKNMKRKMYLFHPEFDCFLIKIMKHT